MFHHILVPIDFTPKNDAALDRTRELASLTGAGVTLLHVIEPIPGTEDDPEVDSLYGRLEASAARSMRRAAMRLGGEDFDVESRIVLGPRVPCIVDHARTSHCDLVVLSSHRVAPNNPASGLLGISYKVAILAPCPVLLVK